MIVEASGGPPLDFDSDANPSPPYPSVTEGEITTSSGLNVRAEEVGLVLLVLLLWAGAVALFFNRWGKIRMLEPYQPKFIDAPRGSLAMAANTAGPPLVVSSAPHRLSYPLIEYAHQVKRQSIVIIVDIKAFVATRCYKAVKEKCRAITITFAVLLYKRSTSATGTLRGILRKNCEAYQH